MKKEEIETEEDLVKSLKNMGFVTKDDMEHEHEHEHEHERKPVASTVITTTNNPSQVTVQKEIVKHPKVIKAHEDLQCDGCGKLHVEKSGKKNILPKKFCSTCGYPADEHTCTHCNKGKVVNRAKFIEKLEAADDKDEEDSEEDEEEEDEEDE